MPTVSPFLSWGFGRYVRRYLRRHFNAVRVARHTIPDLPADDAVICFMNHPGWWDPLIGYFLHGRFLGGRTAYAPIDHTALEQYRVFRKLGFYGVDLNSLEGAKQFLAITRELLTNPANAIWITPGGQFADVRTKTTLQPGLGHVAATASGATLLPIAVEYTFWEERTAEALIEFGRPIRTQAYEMCKEDWLAELEQRLADTLASLAAKAISRDPTHFETVLGGSAGVGGWYDIARRTRSLLTGTSFNPRHSETPTKSGGR
jgi:1-acyl-sn-glycerol-3-phosphate acyltransferase